MKVFMLLLFLLLVICAVSINFIKNILSSIIIFSAYSLIMSVIWILMESPDLAITEAAVGAGVTTLLFYATLKRINLIDVESELDHDAEENNSNAEGSSKTE